MRVQASLLGTLCAPRPAAAVYLPASTGRNEITAVVQFSSPWANFSSGGCGTKYTCLLGVGGKGSVVANSAVELSSPAGSGTLFSVRIAVSGPGSVDVVLRDDPCNPYTQPWFMTVMADFTKPEGTLSVLSEPTLGNSTFVLAANFTEPVQPLRASDLTVSGATVRLVEQPTNSTARFLLDGWPGAVVTAQLASFGYTDFAGNPGVPSNQLSVTVPAPELPKLATGLGVATAASLGASTLSCMAGAFFTPGWTAMACGAGVLRSAGHLQVLGFTNAMSANMPAAYDVVSGTSSWALLQFAPDAATKFATGFSRAKDNTRALVPSPPPPLVRRAHARSH